MTKQPKSQYQSYLLRLWREGEGNAWRAMLEHVGTYERYGFANLEDLCVFLRGWMNSEAQASQNAEIKNMNEATIQ